MGGLMMEYAENYIWGGDFFRGFNPVEECCLFQKLLVLNNINENFLEKSIQDIFWSRLSKDEVGEYRKRMNCEVGN